MSAASNQPTHARTVSLPVASAAAPKTAPPPTPLEVNTLEAEPANRHARIASDVTTLRGGRGTSGTVAMSKCCLPKCVNFAARDAYCLRHVWRMRPDTEAALVAGRSKEAEGQLVAAKEIMTTEKSYLDSLRTLQKAFHHRLATALDLYPTLGRAPLCSADDLDKIFTNIPELLSISEALYADLAELYANNRLVEFVGALFLHYTPSFGVYSTYLEGFDESRKRLLALKDSGDNKEFALWIKTTEKIEGLSLESFLVQPVQRMPRYLLLLKELIRRIPVRTDSDLTTLVLADLHAAHDSLAAATTKLNSSLSTAENASQLKNLSRLFLRTDSRFQSFANLGIGRKLVKMGVLRKKFSNASYNLQSYKSYFFFLTNDLIFYAASATKLGKNDVGSEEDFASGTSHIQMQLAVSNALSDAVAPLYKMKHLYRLEDMFIDRSDPKVSLSSKKALAKKPNPQKLYMWNNDGRVIVLQAASEAERDAWFTAIDTCIEECKRKQKLMMQTKTA